MRTRYAIIAMGAIVLIAGACTPPPTGPAFTTSTVIDGLERPWEVAFTPDGTMLVTERPGRISAVVGGSAVVLAEPPDVRAISEGGMLGLAVDPDYATNRRIYACFISNAGGALDERVVRWTVDPTGTTLTNRNDIVTGIPLNEAGQAGRHSGCRLRFGADGALWITTGDAARADTAQNPVSLGGKVLRVTTDGGPAPGNPGGSADPRIFTLGHRNVQGLSFRPSDGAAFSIEHGTNCDDEVNVLASGANYGWNPGAGGFYDEFAPMTDLATVPQATAAVWSSGCPTIATSGGTFVSGAQWGVWEDALVTAALKGSQLRAISFTAGPTPTVVEEWTALTGLGRLRTVTQGPDGDLYVVTDSANGSILRLSPVEI